MDIVAMNLIEVKMEGEETTKEKGGEDDEDDHTFVNKQSMKKFQARQAELRSSETGSSTSSPNRKPGPASKTGYHKEVKESSSSNKNDPIVSTSKSIRERQESDQPFQKLAKVIPRTAPQIGDFVFVMFKNLEHPWLLAEVLEIVPSYANADQLEYVVHFEATTRQGKPIGEAEIPGESFRKLAQVCLKMIAPPTPCPFQLPVGSRVIAKLINADDPNQFYSGIVADIPKTLERPKHYLIFFDTGAAQYVHSEHVYLICGSDKLVWNDVHPDSYDFIKEYIIKYPRWPMVKVRVGQIVATELAGLWLPSRIKQVDGSLAYVQFEYNGRYQWIFRGSGRLRVAPSRLLEEERKGIENGMLPKGNCYFSTTKKRKSYSVKYIYEEVLYFSGDKDAKGFSINLDDPTLCIEYQGRLEKIEIPKKCPKPRPLINHKCNWRCVYLLSINENIRRLSPLAIPFFFGWTRYKITEPTRHEIYYRAPCGVRLNDAKMLTDFLKLTDSNFTVDHFCFDYDVDCENEFVPARVLLNIEDISNGMEIVSVPLVNSIDWDAPPEFEYLRESELGPGVILNKDQDFLVCCECKDGDCSDQEKCACWQLTKQGIAFTKMNNENYPTQGYENRRLRAKLTSAIYECNDRCLCKKQCTNRVVQNGHQWPLQVYKTRDKGWGVRTLFDIPQGTFVGYYVGEVFQYDYAENLDTGDEYFLALDYVETCGSVKLDYEEDVTDIEAEEDDEDTDSSGSEDKTSKKVKEHRMLYGRNEKAYTVDSKKKGNITRFMNHSCNPNLDPQNVFVDTHDLRFPMVALFTNIHIKAGSELSWDYNYTPGTVDGTTMHCKCKASNCRRRLL